MRQDGRKYYLDNLKVFLTLLVIFHHVGQAYGDGGAWPYVPSNPMEYMPWIWHFFSVNAGFFMGLFFLVSGYFVPTSYDRYGGKVFVKKKLFRLGVPLVVMGGIISMASGKFEIAHMWYVESLLLFCLVYALARLFFKPITGDCSSRVTVLGLAVVALLMGVGSHFIRQVSPQDRWTWPLGIIPLPLEPAHYLQYVMMFVLGLLSRRFNWLERISSRVGVTSLVLGVLFALGIYCSGEGAWKDFVWKWFGVYESFLCMFLSFGLLWLFREYLSGTSAFLRWCSEQSFGAYVVHLPNIIFLQYVFDGVWMGALGKFLFLGVLATVVSYVSVWLLRMIPGVKEVL